MPGGVADTMLALVWPRPRAAGPLWAVTAAVPGGTHLREMSG